jgi:hypothetical protein
VWKIAVSAVVSVLALAGVIALSIFAPPLALILGPLIITVAAALLFLVWTGTPIKELVRRIRIIVITLCMIWLLSLLFGPMGALFAAFFGALLFFGVDISISFGIAVVLTAVLFFWIPSKF